MTNSPGFHGRPRDISLPNRHVAYHYPLTITGQGDESIFMVFCMALAAAINIVHSEHGAIPAERGRRNSDVFLGRGCRPISARGTSNSTLHIFGQRQSYIDFVSGVDTRVLGVFGVLGW